MQELTPTDGADVLEPAHIAFDAGGVPYATRFGDIYHSHDGGPAQARHVFIAGNGLPRRWGGLDAFTIVETGFGLGLNFLCTWAEFLADPLRPRHLHYVAVEKHPASPSDLERAHAPWHALRVLAAELRQRWPPLLRGFHRVEFADARIVLTLLFGDATHMLAELDAVADALYLDGFAPEKNPAMWSEPLFRELARLSKPGTTAATWSVAGQVRTRLAAAGFAVERRPGFGRKRAMLTAVRPGMASRRAHGSQSRHAVVIGAGLAGCWTAFSLARRGWTVEVIERNDEPAREGSGNSIGVLRPALNLADTANARLARSAFLRTADVLVNEDALQGAWMQTGVLHVATTAARAQRMAHILDAHRFAHDYVCWLEAGAAARRAGHAVAGPGWWIERGGWVRPRELCRALLHAAAPRVRVAYASTAGKLAASSSGWQVLDAQGDVIAQAPVVIAANAGGAPRLGLAGLPRLMSVRGQVSELPASVRRSLACVVCGDGYVVALPHGGHYIGATFEPDSTALDLRPADHAANLARANRMLPGFAAGADPATLGGRAALRIATADRLPVCGASRPAAIDADHAGGVYVATGLGARGLIWGALCAEILLSRLEAEPNAIERSLIAALDPAREEPSPRLRRPP
ncbi:MAG: bifunctional tRNA (5-methylaminomethyl-2-thiouridine)(34)-methyltransferase MnmD/FAD-dependent 5-carboxymethylaminomethyl-2-thiouridine(34) oxidoreductase MnmC [Burkholderiales bacterium]|nr:bifunctional tRNA (5-methylaminomethyl-2-thiouridine)(34)-methyltransferase MnmD/FAD-dependent 5-carboxymethylaminomethyl-2-thiouridine(34) oxidoreductase MnmC [Burkholderiales bacterium]